MLVVGVIEVDATKVGAEEERAAFDTTGPDEAEATAAVACARLDACVDVAPGKGSEK